MPLQDPKNDSHYVRLEKVYISSKDRDPDGTVFDYQVQLEKALPFVAAVELTGYNLPGDLAPSFPAPNNVVDFTLHDPASNTTTSFSFTWPHRKFVYQDTTYPAVSYIDTLKQLLEEQIFDDPTFGPSGLNMYFYVTATAALHTVVEVDEGCTISFDFASGPNAGQSAALAMGFPLADTAPAAKVSSQDPVRLTLSRYVDVVLDEIEHRPLQRIYFGGAESAKFNDTAAKTRLLTKPIRRLSSLRVKLALEGGATPTSASSGEHDLVLTFFLVANETMVPDWVAQQSFVL